jgi:hypothetical protein
MAWTWNIGLYLLCYSLLLMLWQMPCRSFLHICYCLHHFIVTRSHCVSSNACKHFLWVLLLNQLSPIVFFISKHILVRWNRWRIRQLLPLNHLPLWLHSSIPLCFIPLNVFRILAWSRSECLLFRLFITESLHSRCETVLRLNDSYSKLLQPIHWQVLSWLHALTDLIKPHLRLILSRTCNSYNWMRYNTWIEDSLHCAHLLSSFSACLTLKWLVSIYILW